MHAVQPVHSPVRTTSSYRSRHCVLSAVETIRGASIGGAIRRPQSLVVPPSVTLDRQREKERSMRSMTWIRLVAVVFSLSLILAACGGDDEGNGGATGATNGGATGETTGGGGENEIVIQGIYFPPAALTVSGQTDVTVTNEDSTPHT